MLPHQPVTAARVTDVAQAGRARWQSANEHHHGLKTKGDQGEHHWGHGKQSLAAFLLSLHLLACLFPPVLEGCDDHEALRRRVLARPQTLFDAIRAGTRYMVFASWQPLMDGMIRGLALAPKLETS